MYRKLFLDGTHISEMRGLCFRGHRGEKHGANPVVRRELPWEQGGIQLYGRSVIYDSRASLFRMYYLSYMNDPRCPGEPFMLNGVQKPSNTTLPAYAESVDGVHWAKPMLNQCVVNDYDETNIIDVLVGQSFEPGVLYDPDDADAGRGYKMMYWGQRSQFVPPGKRVYKGFYRDARLQVLDDEGEVVWERADNVDTQQFGMYAAFSRDGVNWELYSKLPVFTTYSDTGHSVLRDWRSGKYVAFGRFRWTPKSPDFDICRNVARVQSDDFVNWGESELVLAADSRDPHDTHINSVNVDFYEGMYVALMEIGDSMKPAERPSGPMQLAASHDGVHWTRVADRFGFLDTDEANDWDYGGHIKPGSSLMTVGDRIYMYYGGGAGKQLRDAFALATWRRDGFVSLHADEQGGELVTMPLVVEGGFLHLNVDAGAGKVEVAICGGQGEMRLGWQSREIRVDSTDVVVEWEEGDLGRLRGQLVSLRVRMTNADLYSYWFAD